MNWLLVALSAYLLLAIANLLDKFLVDNILKSSKAYAFIACIFGLAVMIVSPWYLDWPGLDWFFFNLLTGAIFAIALWCLYEALKRGEAARTLVFIGGLTPVFSIIFSLIFFQDKYSANQWTGMLLLFSGVLVIAFLPQPRSFLARLLGKLGIKQRAGRAGLLIALFSAVAYAAYFVATKHAYNHQPFLSAFLWTRLGAALFVLLFLIKAEDRQAIKNIFRKSSPTKRRGLVFVNQALGSGGFILQNYAVSLGPVALVNALQGFQYAFLLLISALLAALSPRLLRETFSWPIVLQKAGAILLVGIGLYFIAF